MHVNLFVFLLFARFLCLHPKKVIEGMYTEGCKIFCSVFQKIYMCKFVCRKIVPRYISFYCYLFSFFGMWILVWTKQQKRYNIRASIIFFLGFHDFQSEFNLFIVICIQVVCIIRCHFIKPPAHNFVYRLWPYVCGHLLPMFLLLIMCLWLRFALTVQLLTHRLVSYITF